MEKYEQLARDILESTCETDEIFEDYDMDLLDAGYLDSFSLLNIIVEIEDKMGIALQPTDMKKDNIRTVNDMIRFLEQIGGKNG
ncbi:MAG: phosphopantetheine-binding protein [Clostridiales bacterium]|nr:phosphopantetheine-binding protein [Clostridiales bacterium]